MKMIDAFIVSLFAAAVALTALNFMGRGQAGATIESFTIHEIPSGANHPGAGHSAI